MAITNRIVTRGLGPSRGKAGRAGLVTQGYGGIVSVILTAAATARRTAGRAARHAEKRIEEIVVYAKLLRVNQERIPQKIEGSIRIPNKLVQGAIRLIEVIKTRAVSLVDVIVKRIK